MALQRPVAAYEPASNWEAQLVKVLLTEAGIEAYVSEDLSTAGIWEFGVLPGIHKPQVWVEAGNLELAKMVLNDYEARRAQLNSPTQSDDNMDALPPIEVPCEECQESSLYPAELFGTVQECPKCGAFVDVGEVDESDPYWLEDDEEEDEDEDDGDDEPYDEELE